MGLSENLNINEINALGLKLIKNLVKQLEGDLKIESDEGISFQIIFY